LVVDYLTTLLSIWDTFSFQLIINPS
jgi:hypothetical protein